MRRTALRPLLALVLLYSVPAAAGIPMATSLEVIASATGQVFLSADGAGSFGPLPIQVDKPSNDASVLRAIFACGTGAQGSITANDITLDGNLIAWDVIVGNGAGPAGRALFENAYSDVTAIVAPKVDAAAAGLVTFTQMEIADVLGHINGCALYVLFEDPSLPGDRSAIVLFGGLDTTGDAFTVTLAEPLAGGDPSEFGVAISHGFQGTSGDSVCGDSLAQFTTIDVNAQRLTSCAGGQDDSNSTRGITVGGIGDDPANPTDPFQMPSDGAEPRILEDELYTLSDVLAPGVTAIHIASFNESQDDSVFAAHMLFGAPAVVGDGMLLTPVSDTNPLGSEHTVTALVVDDEGDPVVGVIVDFDILTGPHAGLTGSDVTDANGEASFTWLGVSAGTDTVQAFANTLEGSTARATKLWDISPSVLIDFDDVPTVNQGPAVPIAQDRYLALGVRLSTTTGAGLFAVDADGFATHSAPNYLFSNTSAAPGACTQQGVACDALGDVVVEFFAPGDAGRPAATSAASFYLADDETGDGGPWTARIYDGTGALLDETTGTSNDELRIAFERPQPDIHRLVFTPFDAGSGDDAGIDSLEFVNPTVADLPGDFNGDGFVGGPDFDIFLQCFNQAVPSAGPPDDPDCAESDMNDDGFVGGPDFDLFLQVFNQPAGGCGLGFELGLWLPLWSALRGRRRRRTAASGGRAAGGTGVA